MPPSAPPDNVSHVAHHKCCQCGHGAESPRCSLVAGTYVLLHEGRGTITVSGDASITSSAAGRLVLQISPASGFAVRITATNTSDPVRNIRVVATAFEGNYSRQVYQPAFVQQVAGGAPDVLPGALLLHCCPGCMLPS